MSEMTVAHEIDGPLLCVVKIELPFLSINSGSVLGAWCSSESGVTTRPCFDSNPQRRFG